MVNHGFSFSEYLKVRSHDPEEAIRHDVIVSIVTAAKKDLLLVNDHLLNFVRERTLDKRVRIELVYLFLLLCMSDHSDIQVVWEAALGLVLISFCPCQMDFAFQ